MSTSQSDSSYGSSFASSDGGSSVGSDNTDSRALNVINQGSGDGEEADDLDSSNKSFQEALYATLFTLTKDKRLETSVRLALFKVIVEFLQMFRVLFNTTFPWIIQTDLWIFRGIQWLLFKLLIVPKGYDTYILMFYILAGLVLASMAATVYLAIVLKGSESSNIWVNRLVRGLQLFSMIIYTIFWPAMLDFFTSLLDCDWVHLNEVHGSQNLAGNQDNFPHHFFYPSQNCLALPHLGHMIFAGVMVIIFAGMALLMAAGGCDMNPMTRSIISSSDAVASYKILGLKMIIVMTCSCLDSYMRVQIVFMLLAMVGICYYLIFDLPYYRKDVNITVSGLWVGLLLVACLLTSLEFTKDRHPEPAYAYTLTWAVLYGIFPAVAAGGLACWLRMTLVNRLSAKLKAAFEDRKNAATAAGSNEHDANGRAAGGSVVALIPVGGLKKVYRFKDVRQVSMLMRSMRKWDEDGVPDLHATEFGEFLLKCAMARMENNPALLIMYANFMIEVRKDGQAARTQMQLAQKGNPSMLDNYNIYVAQQLSKQLKRDGDGLDLLGYVEFQRNYRACVRAHRLALTAQRQFWNTLLRDTVSFTELQSRMQGMAKTEERATTVYRRVLERYPGNGKVMKVYGRYLEFVRNDPWTAAKYYEEALKQGTTESMLAMTAGQAGNDSLTAAVGAINEKNDGLVVINAQGIILMVNPAAVAMFGYDKGELEGKNVSVLMPQPFSTRHNSFLQRYVDTGVAHVLNKTRSMVALHKDHSTFPVILCATRLSGVGSEMLFMGLIRRVAPISSEGRTIIRFWTAGTGTIMCCDQSTADSLGLHAASLVGQQFCNLCTHVEEVSRFISTATNGTASSTDSQRQTLRTQLVHHFLPPIDVELSFEFGGATDNSQDCRTICIEACFLSESNAVMVVDHKARIVHATGKLSAMLGYPVMTLQKMELNSLLPQPFCQMHGEWFKDLSKAPGPNSCRSGAVVHVLAANGAKLPVRLNLSTREDTSSGKALHVVQVTEVSSSDQVNQKRLLLNLNHKGRVLDVNPGAKKNLYGFEPSEVVGRPLAAFVDVFGLWRHKFGDDTSLLAMLAAQSLDHKAGKSGAVNACWRVGVHMPVKSDAEIADHAAKLDSEATANSMGMETAGQPGVLQLLQKRNRLQAACMTVEVVEQPADLLLADASLIDTIPVLQVMLFRADGLTCVVELDKHLTITHADEEAGLLFGVNSKHLLKQSLAKLVGLSSTATFEDLLGSKGPASSAKKGALKTGAGGPGASRIGKPKLVTGRHLGDGQALQIQMQATSYEQGGKTKLLVRLQLQEPRSASMCALVRAKEGQAVATQVETKGSGKLAIQNPEHSAPASINHSHEDAGSSHASDAGEGGDDVNRPSRAMRPACMESFARTSDWVRETSQLPESQEPSPTNQRREAASQPIKSKQKQQKHSSDAEELLEDGAVTYVAEKHRGKRQQGPQEKGKWHDQEVKAGAPGKHRVSLHEDEAAFVEDSKIEETKDYDTRSAGPGSVAESASAAGSASVGDGGSEAGDNNSSAAGAHDEDLAVDARRAKRLKKLNRMVLSSVAQAATNVWKQYTLGLLLVILAAHVACFAVLYSQINDRYANAQDVADIARALDRFQAIILRSNYLQKCSLAVFDNTAGCDTESLHHHLDKLTLNTQLAHTYHHKLFLGSEGVQTWKDSRLLSGPEPTCVEWFASLHQDYWAYRTMPESTYMGETVAADGSVQETVIIQNRTLWDMGNVLVTAAQVFDYRMKSLGDLSRLGNVSLADMDFQWAWHYIFLNGPQSMFFGYFWSLDTFTDYTWKDLTTLSVTLIILLVVEGLIVQLSCIGYEFILLQRCNVSHMRLFSVFLVLPSATVRLMAQRQLQIDDDSKEEMEEDDLELADGGTGAPGQAAAPAISADVDNPAATKQHKSVRMFMADENSDGEDKTSKRGKVHATEADGRSSSKNKSKLATSKTGKKVLTGFAGWKHRTYKKLFGWLDPKFKRNGKKLKSSSAVVWKFMVPLMLWVALVAIMFGVSYNKLQGLVGPLASLNTASHVMFRFSRCRLFSNLLAYSTSAAEISSSRASLQFELEQLRKEYSVLLYGGRMELNPEVKVSFDPVCPAGVFIDSSIADLFFRTTSCLRQDKSTCIEDPSDSYYQITHSGLDALLQHYLDEMDVFANAPDDKTFADNPSYAWSMAIAGNDLYDGMQTAADAFVNWMISRLESVKQLHIILLCIFLALNVLFLFMLYRPYIKQLHHETKSVAGLLSQLPAEVDVEGHVKTIVLGFVKPANGSGSMIDTATRAAPGMPGYGLGAGYLNSMGPAVGQMMTPAGYGAKEFNAAAKGKSMGWFGRNKAASAQGQMLGNQMYGMADDAMMLNQMYRGSEAGYQVS